MMGTVIIRETASPAKNSASITTRYVRADIGTEHLDVELG
jgi:hypothetical protein